MNEGDIFREFLLNEFFYSTRLKFAQKKSEIFYLYRIQNKILHLQHT